MLTFRKEVSSRSTFRLASKSKDRRFPFGSVCAQSLLFLNSVIYWLWREKYRLWFHPLGHSLVALGCALPWMEPTAFAQSNQLSGPARPAVTSHLGAGMVPPEIVRAAFRVVFCGFLGPPVPVIGSPRHQAPRRQCTFAVFPHPPHGPLYFSSSADKYCDKETLILISLFVFVLRCVFFFCCNMLKAEYCRFSKVV